MKKRGGYRNIMVNGRAYTYVLSFPKNKKPTLYFYDTQDVRHKMPLRRKLAKKIIERMIESYYGELE